MAKKVKAVKVKADEAPNIAAISPTPEPLKVSAKVAFITANPIEAEKLQKGSGIIPLVTGNRLEGTREYKFVGLTEDKAKELLK